MKGSHGASPELGICTNDGALDSKAIEVFLECRSQQRRQELFGKTCKSFLQYDAKQLPKIGRLMSPCGTKDDFCAAGENPAGGSYADAHLASRRRIEEAYCKCFQTKFTVCVQSRVRKGAWSTLCSSHATSPNTFGNLGTSSGERGTHQKTNTKAQTRRERNPD